MTTPERTGSGVVGATGAPFSRLLRETDGAPSRPGGIWGRRIRRRGHADAETAPPAAADWPGRRGLLEPGRNVWRIAEADRAAVLVDAATYFGALRQSLAKARHTITIVGWDVDSRTRLVGPSGKADDGLPEELGAFLTALLAKNRDLRVRVLLWDYSLLYALEREFVHALQLQWATPRRIEVCLDDDLPVGSAQHQKVVVVDEAIAFAGGLDLTIRRWDTGEHDPANSNRVDPAGKPYKPFHDIQMVVDGPAAAILSDLVRTRWEDAALEDLPRVPATGLDYWPDVVRPQFRRVPIGVARTVPPCVRGGAAHEVEALFFDMIDAAERWIYIENQFLTAGSIAQRLAERLKANPKLEAVLVCPRTHHTWIEHRTMLAGRIRFKAVLDAAGCPDRVRVVYPSVGAGDDATEVMVHAKVMIVDDRILRVGSANLANRSFGADSECDLVVDAQTPAERLGVAGMRDRLLAEHCGATPEAVAAVLAETGSIVAAVDRLSSDARGLRRVDDGVLGADDPPAGIEMIADPPRPIGAVDFLADFDGGRTSPRRLGRWLLLGGLLLGLLALVLAWRYTPLAAMTDPQRIADYLTRFNDGGWGLPLTLGVFIVGGLIVFPVTVLIGATAAAFGLWPGILYAGAGAMASALVTYAIGRFMGAAPLRRIMGPRMNRIRQTVADHGIFAVATIRLMPIAPFTFVNLVAGASRIRVVDYTIGTALGLAPGLAVMASLGESLLQTLRDPSAGGIAQILLIVIGWILLSFGFHTVVTRMRARRR
jgi:phospholipase D1/2